MAKECTLSTRRLTPGGLPINSVVIIIDRPDMTIAVYRGRKALNQTHNLHDSTFIYRDIRSDFSPYASL